MGQGPAARLANSTGTALAAIAALAAPTLLFPYLPMTDLPQHTAVLSMLLHMDDPAFGFDAFYRVAFERTLYLVPYGIGLGLATVLPLELAMRGVVFLAVVAYPLGALAVLRAQGKPAALALLALPLAYNQTFFWGFLHFGMALGMALGAIALLIRPQRGLGAEVALWLLSLGLAFTHVYGLALLFGYAFLWLLLGERAALARALPALAPALIGALIWAWLVRGATGFGPWVFEPFSARVSGFPDAVLGGYRGPSEEMLLLLFFAVGMLMFRRTFPITRARWSALEPHERVFASYCLLNVVLYFALPTHTENAKFVHFRHAVIAAALFPLALPARGLRDGGTAGRLGLALLTIASIALAWVGLARFDREARSFDAVLARLPDRPRIMILNWERTGEVVQTAAYHHFAAYAQARRGGLISRTFPQMFWNIPVDLRRDVGIPDMNIDLEFRPASFDYERYGYFYDWLLVRARPEQEHRIKTIDVFPYELVYRDPPWRLYRKSGDVD